MLFEKENNDNTLDENIKESFRNYLTKEYSNYQNKQKEISQTLTPYIKITMFISWCLFALYLFSSSDLNNYVEGFIYDQDIYNRTSYSRNCDSPKWFSG